MDPALPRQLLQQLLGPLAAKGAALCLRLRVFQLREPFPQALLRFLQLGKCRSPGGERLSGAAGGGLGRLSRRLPPLQLPIAGQLAFQQPDPVRDGLQLLPGRRVPVQGALRLVQGPPSQIQPLLLAFDLRQKALQRGPGLLRPLQGRQGLPKGRVRPLQPRLPPFDLRRSGLQGAQMRLLALPLPQQGVHALRRALLGVQRGEPTVERGARVPALVQLSLLPLRQAAQILQQRRVLRLEALQLLRIQTLRGAELRQHQKAQLLAPAAAPVPQRVPGALQQILVAQIEGIVEELAQDLVFLVAVGPQELLELPLGQHDDLAELLRVQAQQLLAALPHPVGALQRRPLRLLQQGRDREAQLHLRVDGLGRVVAVQHVPLPVVAAGHAEEGEHDGVKDGGLAGAGVPGHQIEAPLQLLEGQDRGLRIGAEGRHFQRERSHGRASCSVR